MVHRGGGGEGLSAVVVGTRAGDAGFVEDRAFDMGQHFFGPHIMLCSRVCMARIQPKKASCSVVTQINPALVQQHVLWATPIVWTAPQGKQIRNRGMICLMCENLGEDFGKGRCRNGVQPTAGVLVGEGVCGTLGV